MIAWFVHWQSHIYRILSLLGSFKLTHLLAGLYQLLFTHINLAGNLLDQRGASFRQSGRTNCICQLESQAHPPWPRCHQQSPFPPTAAPSLSRNPTEEYAPHPCRSGLFGRGAWHCEQSLLRLLQKMTMTLGLDYQRPLSQEAFMNECRWAVFHTLSRHGVHMDASYWACAFDANCRAARRVRRLIVSYDKRNQFVIKWKLWNPTDSNHIMDCGMNLIYFCSCIEFSKGA